MTKKSSGIDVFLRHLVDKAGSDLHLKAGARPMIRIDGRLEPGPFEALSPEETEQAARAIMPERSAQEFEEFAETDFAYSVEGLGRFRCNIFKQKGQVGVAIRLVLPPAASFESLGLPGAVEQLAKAHRGLILVTGMTGSGKSTTTGAIIDYINRTQPVHIMTIEDPIEIIHGDKTAIVNQREVGMDTADFKQALRRVLRQDPDVIFLGEMRDEETAQTAINAAETGHLVISTLHTIDAQETVNRVIEFFEPHQQKQARIALASALKGVICQRLLPGASGGGRVAAVEVMVSNGRIQDIIMDPEKTHQMHEVIAESGFYGMQTFDQCLLELFQAGKVKLEDAMAASSHPHDFEIMVRQAGLLAG